MIGRPSDRPDTQPGGRPRTSAGRSRYLARVLGINLTATLVVMVAQGAFIHPMASARLVRIFLVSALFCNTMGGLIASIMPQAAPSLWRWRFPLNWLGLVMLLMAINAVGTGFGLAVLGVFRVVHWADFAREFAWSFRFGAFFTLFFGIAGTLYESVRSELQQTTLALRTKELEEERARKLALEAQLAALESRVNPHFLFNTLNSIAALVHEDPRAAERMTAQLASLMRSALDHHSTALVPLDDELQSVRHYLEIERVRFGDRLRYRVSVEAGVEGARVPRLAVQTLAENSVKYAIAPRRDGGSIAIRAAAQNGQVRLEVEDDGPGFDPSTLPDGHGLALLRARLALTFGERAALAIDSRPGRTRVAIDLPS